MNFTHFKSWFSKNHLAVLLSFCIISSGMAVFFGVQLKMQETQNEVSPPTRVSDLSSPQGSYLEGGAFTQLLSTYPDSIKAIHQHMAQLSIQDDSARIKHLFPEPFPIPHDYRYWLDSILTKEQAISQEPEIDSNLIFWDRGISAYWSVFFNEDREIPSWVKPEKEWLQGSYDSCLILTGTYTSPFSWPAGLAINQGKVLNPAIQDWDGMLILDTLGRLQLWSISDFSWQGLNLNLTKGRTGYNRFLKIANQEKWSVIQAHLLVYDGTNLVEPLDNAASVSRRALFFTENGDIGIYNSDSTQMSLYELGETLRTRYQAVSAINLDMGGYDFARKYAREGSSKDLSKQLPASVLSNFLVIKWNP